MTKDQFIRELNAALKKIPERERKDLIQDFEEHFEIGRMEGKSDGDIAEALGQPRQIAKEILATYHVEKAGSTVTTGNVIRAVWAVIGLGFFNLVIVLGPFLAIVGVCIGLWGVSIGFVLSPLLFLLDLFMNLGGFHFFNLFASMALCGFGILLGLVLCKLTLLLLKGLIKYLHYNVSLVKGGVFH